MRTDSPRGKPGETVVVSLRPEALRLLAPGEAALPGWATLSGTLGDIEYLGPVTRFAVALADGALLHLMALAPPSMMALCAGTAEKAPGMAFEAMLFLSQDASPEPVRQRATPIPSVSRLPNGPDDRYRPRNPFSRGLTQP